MTAFQQTLKKVVQRGARLTGRALSCWLHVSSVGTICSSSEPAAASGRRLGSASGALGSVRTAVMSPRICRIHGITMNFPNEKYHATIFHLVCRPLIRTATVKCGDPVFSWDRINKTPDLLESERRVGLSAARPNGGHDVTHVLHLQLRADLLQHRVRQETHTKPETLNRVRVTECVSERVSERFTVMHLWLSVTCRCVSVLELGGASVSVWTDLQRRVQLKRLH